MFSFCSIAYSKRFCSYFYVVAKILSFHKIYGKQFYSRKDSSMDHYQMGRSCNRPYNRTCGMNRPQYINAPQQKASSCSPNPDTNCSKSRKNGSDKEMYTHLSHLEPAMAYVPYQTFTETFTLPYALNAGTVFPELCKPFCGKRGSCR